MKGSDTNETCTVKQIEKCRIAIVGLGLMGGSLAGALRGKVGAVVGVARRRETVQAALKGGLVDEGTTELTAGVKGVDIVVLATPVRVIVQQIAEVGPLLEESCLLMDLGSTKAEILREMAKLPEGIQVLGGHPMCGKETSGVEATEPGIYQGATFILSPLPRTAEWALSLGQDLARTVGSEPLVLDGERQDFLVATLSHLPYLMACGLIATADRTTSPDAAAWRIVAGGFRDTTRIAASDVTMMTDILVTNREEVLRALGTFQEEIRSLGDLIESSNEEALRRRLGKIREKRLEMYP